MVVGIYIGVILPIAEMDVIEFEWYRPLIAVTLGGLGLVMFYIPLRHGDSFDLNQEHNLRFRRDVTQVSKNE